MIVVHFVFFFCFCRCLLLHVWTRRNQIFLVEYSLCIIVARECLNSVFFFFVSLFANRFSNVSKRLKSACATGSRACAGISHFGWIRSMTAATSTTMKNTSKNEEKKLHWPLDIHLNRQFCRDIENKLKRGEISVHPLLAIYSSTVSLSHQIIACLSLHTFVFVHCRLHSAFLSSFYFMRVLQHTFWLISMQRCCILFNSTTEFTCSNWFLFSFLLDANQIIFAFLCVHLANCSRTRLIDK